MSGYYAPKTSLTLILAGDQLPTFFGKRFVIVNSGLCLTIRELSSDSKLSNPGAEMKLHNVLSRETRGFTRYVFQG